MSWPAAASLPLTRDHLLQNRWLVLDTANFSTRFRDDLVADLADLDSRCAGVAINSENYQGLNLAREKMRGRSRLIYIDPPYNTDASAIAYKND